MSLRKSAGLLDTVKVNGSDGSSMTGRYRARVLCPVCFAVVGKVFTVGPAVFLNYYQRERPGLWLEYREETGSEGWVDGPVIVNSARLQGPHYPDRVSWCDRDGMALSIELSKVFAAVERAVSDGRIEKAIAARLIEDADGIGND